MRDDGVKRLVRLVRGRPQPRRRASHQDAAEVAGRAIAAGHCGDPPRALRRHTAQESREEAPSVAQAAMPPSRNEVIAKRPRASARGRSSEPPADCAADGEVRNLVPPLLTPLARSARGLDEARTSVSPTPSVVDRGRRVEGDARCATAPRRPPARLTQSSTSFEVEDCEERRAYFFFRRLVFFAPFFAADFVFVFRFFAMLPS